MALPKAPLSVVAVKTEAEALTTCRDLMAIGSMFPILRAMEDRVNGKFTLPQWMIGFSLALNSAILLKLLAH